MLDAGGLLVYPTETFYALGGRALDPVAARAVRRAKGREEDKPLPLVTASLDQVRSVVVAWPDAAERLAARFWPGPLTLVLLAAAAVPGDVTAGTGTVALRVPGLELTRRLCAAVGPLVSTSANRAGEPAPRTVKEAVDAVGDEAALALDAGPGGELPSTLVDLTTEPPRLVREGAIAWARVAEALRTGAKPG